MVVGHGGSTTGAASVLLRPSFVHADASAVPALHHLQGKRLGIETFKNVWSMQRD
jgi:hypothetical protein